VESDERDLVARCLARDERAYRELVRRYQRPVLNLAWRITGDAEEAAEVAQETFVRVLRSLSSYDPGRPLRSWLFKIAANLALDSLRRRKRRPVALEDLSDEEGRPSIEAVDTGPPPDAGLLEDWSLPGDSLPAIPGTAGIRRDRRDAGDPAGHRKGAPPPGARDSET